MTPTPIPQLQPATVTLIDQIKTYTDAQLQVLEGHFKQAYDTFLAAQPLVNGKPPADNPFLRQAAQMQTDADTRAVYRAVTQRRQQLTIAANQAEFNAKLAALAVPQNVATPILTGLKTNLGL